VPVGWTRGKRFIVAGPTSLGQSAFALGAAAHAAIDARVPTAIFSIEMTRTENTIRILALESAIDLHQLMHGRLDEAQMTLLEQAARRVHAAPIYLDDTATRVSEIRARARRLKAEHGLGLVVVDHIHD